MTILPRQVTKTRHGNNRMHVDDDFVGEGRLVKHPFGIPERIWVAIDCVGAWSRRAARIYGGITEFLAIDRCGPTGLRHQDQCAGGGGAVNLEVCAHGNEAEGKGNQQTSN